MFFFALLVIYTKDFVFLYDADTYVCHYFIIFMHYICTLEC